MGDTIFTCDGKPWCSLNVSHDRDGIKFHIDQGSRYDYGEIVVTVEQAKELARRLIEDFE